MPLENWAQLAEIIAAGGVIVSLLYLAAQVRQSNVLARSQARQALMQSSLEELFKIVDEPSTYTSFTDEAATPEDKARMVHWLLGELRAREHDWFQFHDGMIDDDLFNAHMTIVDVLLSTERSRRVWAKYRHMFAPGFAALVDGKVAATPATDRFFSVEDI